MVVDKCTIDSLIFTLSTFGVICYIILYYTIYLRNNYRFTGKIAPRYQQMLQSRLDFTMPAWIETELMFSALVMLRC
jgi:hypothetical protein